MVLGNCSIAVLASLGGLGQVLAVLGFVQGTHQFFYHSSYVVIV